MKLQGYRRDGTLRVLIPGGLTILLHGELASPPLDDAEADRLGPWIDPDTPLSWQERNQLAKRLDRSRVVPAHTLAMRRGEFSSPTGPLTGGLLARLSEIREIDLGGSGSGNFGHAGRKGEEGGSAAGGGGEAKVVSETGVTHSKSISKEDAANQARNYEQATGRRAVVVPSKPKFDPNEMREDFEHKAKSKPVYDPTVIGEHTRASLPRVQADAAIQSELEEQRDPEKAEAASKAEAAKHAGWMSPKASEGESGRGPRRTMKRLKLEYEVDDSEGERKPVSEVAEGSQSNDNKSVPDHLKPMEKRS